MKILLVKVKLAMKMMVRMRREGRRAKVREVAGKWSRQQTTAPMLYSPLLYLYLLYSALFQKGPTMGH